MGQPGFYSRREIAQIVQKIRSPHMDFGAGKVFFVNGQTGSDSNPGDDPERPLATIVAALAKCVSYRGDYIMVIRGGTETHPMAIATHRAHIIGITNEAIQTVAGWASGAAACFTIDADHVEVAGVMMLADATHPGMELLNNCWGFWVHHCRFGTTIAMQDGIVRGAGGGVEGPVGGLIEDNVFGQEIARDGLRLTAPTYTAIRNNLHMVHGGVAIHVTGGNFLEISGNRIVGHNVQGDAITVAGAGGLVVNNQVGYLDADAIGYEPFVDNGTNHWVNNTGNAVVMGPA